MAVALDCVPGWLCQLPCTSGWSTDIAATCSSHHSTNCYFVDI